MNLEYLLLDDPALRIPLRWHTEDDILAFARVALQRFVERLGQLDPSPVADRLTARLGMLSNACDLLAMALESNLNGYSNEAVRHLEGAIELFDQDIERLVLPFEFDQKLILYRMRRQIGRQLERSELFHIPFESRHLVGPQRYSIPGVPCLYLSGSLYTCWEELGRPPLHELQVAGFWPEMSIQAQVLDLYWDPARIAYTARQLLTGGSEEQIDQSISHVYVWPIIAMCSLVVKHKSGTFKPEHIIPQMMLQWVRRRRGIDGLYYRSCNVEASVQAGTLKTANFVFPAQEISLRGRCPRLCSLFRMTKPHSWEFLESINIRSGGPISAVPNYDIEFISGESEPYFATAFGKVERNVNMMVLRSWNQTACDPEDGKVDAV